VIGALSPRARNAQVALYQAGEVDFLVATDAIGMGLNLDIDHVAFADVRKFDGREARSLELAELGQIAGRAGRYTRDGTFGTLSPLAPFSPGVTSALEQHRFEPVRRLYWRSTDLDFTDIDSLRASLAMRSPSPLLRRADDPALDAATLDALSERDEARARIRSADDVRLLWAVCGLPDYRQLLFEDHVGIALKLFTDLADKGTVELAWVERELARLDEPADDPETLMARIAQLRTWNYVAHQPGWLSHPRALQGRAANLEDSLSDALHRALVARFVDRTRKPAPKAAPSEKGRAKPSEPGKSSPFAALAQFLEPPNASLELAPDETRDRLFERAIDATFDAFEIDRDGVVSFENVRLGRLSRGRDLLSPEVVVVVETSPGMKLRLARRLLAWSRDLVSSLVGSFRDIEGLSPSARGLVHSLTRRLGTVLVAEASDQLAALDAGERARLEDAGVLIGNAVLYSPLLLKPPAMTQRLALVTAYDASTRRLPRGTEVSIAPLRGLSPELHSALGYPLIGPRAVRADVLERFRNRLQTARDEGSEIAATSFAGWLGARVREAEEVRAHLFPGEPASA
jgi:ATP-dependent RNA helicase SUPV3L1/SUV3